MPTESDLRSFLQEAGPTSTRQRTPLDTSRVVRRARLRRLPKQIAIGGTCTLAVTGIAVASIQGLQLADPLSATPGGSASEGDAGSVIEPDFPIPIDDDAMGHAPAERLNLCEGTLAEVAPSVTGLVLTTTFPDGAPADGSSVQGTVTLTNTGTQRVTGITGPFPAITLSQTGTVLWHSNGPTIATAMATRVDLGPGEVLEYNAAFTPVRCGVEDDTAESFRENLPPLTAGTYEVAAAIDINLDVPVNGSYAFDLITGPLESVSLG